MSDLMKKKSTKISIRLKDYDFNRLQELSAITGCNISICVRTCVKKTLDELTDESGNLKIKSSAIS